MLLPLAHVTLLDMGVLTLVFALGSLLGFACAMWRLEGRLSTQRLRPPGRRDRDPG